MTADQRAELLLYRLERLTEILMPILDLADEQCVSSLAVGNRLRAHKNELRSHLTEIRNPK